MSEQAEDMRNTPIEEIIREQNVPVPVDRMGPLQYNDADPCIYQRMQYFTLCTWTANPKLNVTNKGVAEMFKLSSK